MIGTNISRRRAIQLAVGVAGYAALSGGAAALLDACGSSPTTSAFNKTSLSFGLDNNVSNLDPALMGLLAEFQVGTSVYDQLLWLIPDYGSKYYPGLATNYSASSDGKSFTFNLRNNAKFHDGTPVNAAAVKFTFDRIANPATKAGASLITLGDYDSTDIISEFTAKVNFKSPNAGFLNNVTYPPLAIVSPTAVQKYGANFTINPVGSGPYKFQSFTSGESVVLTKNPEYHWGPPIAGLTGPAKLQTITFRIIEQSATQSSALQSGELDIAYDLDTPDVVALTKNGKYAKDIRLIPGLPVSFVFNVKKPPTDELAVRQAVSYATDKKTIMKSLYNGLYSPATSVLAPTDPGYNSTDFYPFDLAKANSILENAGWKMGSSGIREKNGNQLEVSWLMPIGFGNPQPVAELIAQQIQKAGVKSSISSAASPGVFTEVSDGVMNLSYAFYQAADPGMLDIWFTCANSTNQGIGYCSTNTDNLLAQADGAVDATNRYDLYKQIQQVLMGDAVSLPVYANNASFVYPPALKDVRFTSVQLPMFTAV